jgi:hypothetical protein
VSVYDFTDFKNSDFGESISYTPSGGAAATIKACVFRRGSDKASPPGGIPTQVYPLVIEIDPVDVPIVTVQKDAVTCTDFNGTSRTFRVAKILYSDPGCFKLGLA